MNNLVLKVLDEAAKDNKVFIIIAVVVFVLLILGLFIYLASCIIIVKQGTRKIVERFGQYNRTLKEGIHIIFRPFDKIAPVPWNILSITERDEYNRNRVSKKTRYYNDKGHSDGRTASGIDLAKYQKETDRLNNYIARKLEKDIRLLTREEFIDKGEKISEAYADTIDIDSITVNKTGKRLNALIEEIVNANDCLGEFTRAYHEMGLDPYRAEPELIRAVKDKDALAASVRYYPRHQDPHSRHAKFYKMAENHVQDFVDLRERHIDTANPWVKDRYINTNRLSSGGESFYFANRDSNFEGVKLITKDNASIGANIVIFFSITDPFLYYYGVDEPEESLVLLAITTLRNIASTYTLEEILQARTDINQKIRTELDIATNNWGIKANRVEIKEFELHDEMQKAMDDVLIAERDRRANLLRADSYKRMKEDGVMAAHLKLKGYEALEVVSQGSSNKVFIPSDLSDFITGAHVVADAFAETKNTKK